MQDNCKSKEIFCQQNRKSAHNRRIPGPDISKISCRRGRGVLMHKQITADFSCKCCKVKKKNSLESEVK